MATAFPIQSLPDGRVKYSDGSIRGAQSSSTFGHVSTQSSGPARNQPINNGSILGVTDTASTSYRPVSQPQPQPGPDTSSFVNNAQSDRDRTLGAIQARLNETRNLAGEKIKQATGDRDYIMDLINKRFPDLINRANARRTEAIGELDAEGVQLGQLYDRANAQARRRSEDAALQNRMSARAGNRLGSSFYDDAVASNQENLIDVLGASNQEEITKTDALGRRKSETGRYFDETVKDIEYQRDAASQQAISDYQNAVAQAEALSRAGVLDFGEAQAAAEANLSSKLDQINMWAQNIALQRGNLDKTYSTGNESITGFTTMTPELTNTLGQTQGLGGLQTYTPQVLGATTSGPQSMVDPLSMMSFSRQPEKKPLLETILAGLGLGGGGGRAG